MAELDRAKIIDHNFIKCVREETFPKPPLSLMPQTVGMNRELFLDLFDTQLKSRHLDLVARILKANNLGYYTIGSSGHEGNAIFGALFPYADLAFLHYRSGAFFIQRAKQLKNIDPVRDILLSILASSQDPISAGRHKVFGSVALNLPPQTSTIASHLAKAVGTAISITRAKELNLKSNLAADSIIICSFGDASINHAVAQSALNASEWITNNHYPLPLIFICEDNGIGISVPTPNDWIQSVISNRQYLHYIQANGLDLLDMYQKTKQAEHIARTKKQPVFLHMKCVRLMGHAGSDIESQYLSKEVIIANEFNDPLLHTARIILENNWLTPTEILEKYQDISSMTNSLAEKLAKTPPLSSSKQVMQALLPRLKKRAQLKAITAKERKQFCKQHGINLHGKRDLCRQINFALMELMLINDNIIIFGEDVGKKGGVYRVSADLQHIFGQRRVFDSLLDETMILGSAAGFAHNGFLPIPEIQFLAYVHNAEDQIRGEAASLSFFSNGQYANPMVIRIPSFAYQKGFGGHFHNDNSIAALRDIPGIIIASPSNGADAAKMLRTCVELAQNQGRVVLFLEPIALYMTKDLHQPKDGAWLAEIPGLDETISFGEIGIYPGGSTDIAIISYANGYYLSRQANKILKDKYGINTKVIDLRWLLPINQDGLVKAIKGCKKVLIVDECRQTGSVSETLMALILERLDPIPKVKRLTAADCFIPLGQAWQYLLPSKQAIVDAVVNL